MSDVNELLKRKANIAVRGIIADLSDRRGLRQEWEQIDKDIQQEIFTKWQEIIFDAFTKKRGG